QASRRDATLDELAFHQIILLQQNYLQADSLRSTLEKLYGKNASESADLSPIVNSNHFMSLMSLLDGGKVSSTIVIRGHRNEDSRCVSHGILFSMRWFKLYVCNIVAM
ncbi:hypothetical protein MUK42_24598, partial [Musa troglodytarum]